MTPNEPKPKRTTPSLLRKAGTARRLARSGPGERAAGGAHCRFLAVIMDGNGRWARRRHLPVAAAGPWRRRDARRLPADAGAAPSGRCRP